MESVGQRAGVLSRGDVIRRASVVAAALVVAACHRDRGAEPARRYGLGRAATSVEIAARDIDVGPDGVGLPAGSGTPAQGEAVFTQKCASCHGAHGEGKLPLYPRLVGRDPRAETFAFATDPSLSRTIGDYWPYATTVFDYVRRAMPSTAPGILTNDEVYAVTAYLLAANRVIPAATTLDATVLATVKMPAAGRFVRDTRRGGHEVK
jgi:S-disulfanyl-L-cysteine oxidoreductase SoxD